MFKTVCPLPASSSNRDVLETSPGHGITNRSRTVTFHDRRSRKTAQHTQQHVQKKEQTYGLGLPFQRRVFGAVNYKFRLRFIGRRHSGAAGDVTAADTADTAL